MSSFKLFIRALVGTFHGEFLDGFVMDCPFIYEIVEAFFMITDIDLGLRNYDYCEQVDDLQWRLDPEGLQFYVVAVHSGMLLENTGLYETKPWQKIAD